MNIIEPGIKLDPATTKLVHCKACDATFADKRIPKICPNCGADKKKLSGAKDDDCESFMEAYSEMMAEYVETQSADTSKQDDHDGDISSDFPDGQYPSYDTESPGMMDEHSGFSYEDPAGRSEDSYETASEDVPYEPIGFNPDDFFNSMLPKRKISNLEKKTLLASAETAIREQKWALQRLGLPVDGLQQVLQDIKQHANDLGKNIPGYTSLMLKMYVDRTLQHELAHPRKGRRYDIPEISDMLKELEIRSSCWDSYFAIAGRKAV